jgi:hypothetical protein
MKLLIIAASILLADSAFALIGDDVKHVQARYGPPRQVIEKHPRWQDVGFSSHGFLIIVRFVDGFSRRESFWIPDRTQFTSDRLRDVLSLSLGPARSWLTLSKGWGRSDGKALAILGDRNRLFLVEDGNYVSSDGSNQALQPGR